PAGSLSDWRYLAVSVLAAVVVFLWYPDIDRRRRLVLYFDAAGLALFAVTGTLAALSAGLSPVMAPVMGMTTGIGGGDPARRPRQRDAGGAEERALRDRGAGGRPRRRGRPPPELAVARDRRAGGGAVLLPAHDGDPPRLGTPDGAVARRPRGRPARGRLRAQRRDEIGRAH